MNKKYLVLLLIILALASFFRLWQLDSIPPGLYPDVAINGNDALLALDNHNFKVFYPENNGREGLFINLIALSFLIFGVKIWSIKIVAALFGILTVLGIYLLVKELFQSNKKNSDWIALLSSFFLAVSFWHTLFSRIGFRAIMVPFVLVFGIYFLLKGFRTKKILDFVLAGIFWGVGLHTYISFRMAVIILAAVLILKLIEYLKKEKVEINWHGIWNKMYIKDSWWKVDVFLVVIILVALPIGIYFLQNPGDFMGRATGVSIFAQENPIKSAFLSFGAHLAMFNFYGDGNWRHNFAGSPMLSWPIGILFIVGLILSIRYLIKSIKNKDYPLLTTYSLILVWFLAMLLPGILTAEGIPHALRVIGVIPVVYIFAGIGGWAVYQLFERIIKSKKFLILLYFSFIFLVVITGFNKYFFTWAQNENVEGAFTKKFVEIGYYLNSLPPGISKYVIVNESGVPVPLPDGIPMPAQTVMFIESTEFGDPQSNYLLPENLDEIKIKEDTPNQSFQDATGQAVIVPMKYEENLFNELYQRWPEGKIQENNGIWTYQIND